MSDFSAWATQTPLWIVYLAGLLIGWGARSAHPAASRRVLLAFGLLLLNLIVVEQLTLFLLTQANLQAWELATINQRLFWVSLAGNLLQAWAIWLLLRTIIPASAGPMPGWQRRVIGGVVGLLIGGLLVIVTGDGLGRALGISDFEGERGYFVAFLLVPAAAIVGAIVGALISPRVRR